MNTFKRKAIFAAMLAVAFSTSGCGALSSAVLKSDVVKDDFAATSANLEQAVKLGLLPVNDPAVTCVRAIVARAAADVSFEGQVDGLLSAGSLAYIAAQVAKNRPTVEPECEALVGRVMISGAKRIAR